MLSTWSVAALALAAAACAGGGQDAVDAAGDAAADARPVADSAPAADGLSRPDATPITRVGWPDEFIDWQVLVPANRLIAMRVEVSQAVTITGWGITPRDPATTAEVRMAIYRDAGGQPSALVASSPVFAAAGLLRAAGNEPLSRGRYWLAVNASDELLMGRAADPTTDYCATEQQLDEPLGATYGAPDICTKIEAVNIYLTVE